MAGLKGRKVLITGGAGFIGSNLVSSLLDREAVVAVIDIAISQNSYYVSSGSYKNTSFELVDIRNKDEVFRVFRGFTPDLVFHLAAEPIVEKGYLNPVQTFETNILGTINILEAARKYPVKGMIVASSDKAYGKTEKPYTEETPLKGDHPYDVSKSSADLISQTYFKTYNLPVVITRFGNVYGEGDLHMDRIIPGICEAVIRDETLNIRSNGKYVRDYLYVKDVVDGYLLLANSLEKTIGEAYNFSSSDKLSVLELIKLAEKVFGKKIKYVIKNNAKNEIPYQHLNDQKIKTLGWENQYNLRSTLQTVFNWYNKII